jgi:hypothetical protein
MVRMPDPGERLYQLLPALFRWRDAAVGGPLEAVMDALADQYGRIADATEQLYRQWFIETCDPWAIPLIGALVGADPDLPETGTIPTWRVHVANTVAYQRRKGMLATLERAVASATGWACYAIAEIEETAVSGVLPALPGWHGTTLDLRRRAVLAGLETPFDRSFRSADLTRPGPDPAAVTLFVWRLQAYPVTRATPRRVGPGRYTVDPFGIGRPLFRLPGTRDQPVYRSGPADLPVPLTRAGFRQVRHDRDQTAALHTPIPDPAFELRIGSTVVASDTALVADLGTWAEPWAGTNRRVAIDPERGRVLLREDQPEAALAISYCYAAPGDIGGGPYPRPPQAAPADPAAWHACVPRDFPTPLAALEAWAGSGESGTLEILDSATYPADLRVAVSDTAQLQPTRRLTIRARDGECPCLRGTIRVTGGTVPLELELSGLHLHGTLALEGRLSVRLNDCTIWPESGIALTVGPAPDLTVSLSRCIAGAIEADGAGVALDLRDSIAAGPVTLGGAALRAVRCTMLERVEAGTLPLAEDSLFLATVRIGQPGQGAVRRCYVPPGSLVPPRDGCQPDLALRDADPAALDDVALRARPVLVSRRFGDPGFGQLAAATVAGVREGAGNGYEMGCFNALAEPVRQAALAQAIEDFMPWGWSARTVFVT